MFFYMLHCHTNKFISTHSPEKISSRISRCISNYFGDYKNAFTISLFWKKGLNLRIACTLKQKWHENTWFYALWVPTTVFLKTRWFSYWDSILIFSTRREKKGISWGEKHGIFFPPNSYEKGGYVWPNKRDLKVGLHRVQNLGNSSAELG